MGLTGSRIPSDPRALVPVDRLRDRFKDVAALLPEAACREDAEELLAQRLACSLGWANDGGRQAVNGVLVQLGLRADKFGAIRPQMPAYRAAYYGWLLGLKPSEVFPAPLPREED